MNSIKKRSISKKAFITTVALLLATTCGITYAIVTNNSQTSKSKDALVKPAPSTLSDENAKAKEDFINREQQDKDGVDNSGQDTSNDSITAKQEQDNSVTVITKLYSLSDGKCELELTNGATKIVRSAPVIYQPSYSTCAGFSLPNTELSAGQWEVALTVMPLNGKSTKLKTLISIPQ